PNIDYFLELSDFGFKNIKVATGKSKGTIDIDEGISKIDTNGKLERLYYKDRAFESLEFNLSTKEADALGIISLQENDKNNYDLEFKIPDIKNEKRIEFSKIELNFGDAQFNNDKKLQVDYSDGLKISGLNLGSNNSRLAGEVSFSKKNNLRGDIDFKSFELQNLSELLDMKEPVSGVVNGKINISGSAVSPRFKSDLNINDLKFRDFISEKITLNSSYLDNEIKINLNSDLQDNNKLNLSGVINSGISFGEDKSSFDISGFDLTLLSNNLNLSPFSAFTSHLEEINGVVDLDLKIKGKPQSPKLIGSTNIENTVFKLKQLKNKITINSGQILLDGDKAKFNDFDLSSGEGSATLNGDLNFTDFSYKTLADFDNFMINPKRINTNLSGKLKINGKSEDIYAEGDISLNRTRITISQQKKQQVSEIKFVDELEDEKGEIVIKDEQKGSYFKDNTALDLNVTIPKNSWVRGRGANIELKGALKIDKEYKDDPLITGNISTVRGTYKIFGKLFKIQEGNVNFPGIKELNPLLDVTALYNVSDVDVFVGIGGDVKNPSVKLSSNPALQETDIISYLIFGTSSDQLGTGERSALGSAATGLAGGVALNQLKGVLGDDVSPDVLSFGTGTAGPELEVGKYLNDDIYFAYERKSSSDSGSSIPTNTVKVEYRLLDFLSVGSDVGSEQSGGDLFFKFEY
ncbi:MAG: hypothetical protein GWN11_08730, partial [Candidatus Dadabacteria bacterium]|nr:hypothetical protein [Candidatus Dadabacteria bacterium]